MRSILMPPGRVQAFKLAYIVYFLLGLSLFILTAAYCDRCRNIFVIQYVCSSTDLAITAYLRRSRGADSTGRPNEFKFCFTQINHRIWHTKQVTAFIPFFGCHNMTAVLRCPAPHRKNPMTAGNHDRNCRQLCLFRPRNITHYPARKTMIWLME